MNFSTWGKREEEKRISQICLSQFWIWLLLKSSISWSVGLGWLDLVCLFCWLFLPIVCSQCANSDGGGIPWGHHSPVFSLHLHLLCVQGCVCACAHRLASNSWLYTPTLSSALTFLNLNNLQPSFLVSWILWTMSFHHYHLLLGLPSCTPQVK